MKKPIFSKEELTQLSLENLRNLAKYYDMPYAKKKKKELVNSIYDRLQVEFPGGGSIVTSDELAPEQPFIVNEHGEKVPVSVQVYRIYMSQKDKKE